MGAAAEAVLLWVAIAIYAMSAMAYLISVFFSRNKWSQAATYMAIAGLVLQAGAIGVRWVATGHPPVYGVYEHALTNSFAVALIFIIASRKYAKLNLFGFGALVVTLLMLGHGVMNGVEREALSVQYKSNWIWVHVGFGQLAYGAFVLSALFALAYILKDKAYNAGLSEGDGSIYNKLPTLDHLDDLILKFIAIGFIGETGMIASGSIWASSLWGSYWSWEPLQTWSLVSWLVYGAFLHLRITLGWKGKRAAWLSLLALAGIMFVFWGISLVSDQHTRVL